MTSEKLLHETKGLVAVAILANGILAGCVSPTFKSKKAMLSLSNRVQPEVLFLADNQRTLQTSEPIFELSAFSRAITNVTAHRRPAMELYSLDVVHHVMDKTYDGGKLVVHVGGVNNNSCRSEFSEMMTLLQSSSDRPVYIAPGSHDGYFLGITSPVVREARGMTLGAMNELGGWALAWTPAYEKKRNPENDSKRPFLTYDNLMHLAGTGPVGIDPKWKGYAANVMDKYSYVLAYLASLGIPQPEDCTDQTDCCQSFDIDWDGRILHAGRS